MSFRLGWIGCGRHATQMLLPQIKQHGAEIGAFCDIDSVAVSAVAQQYGVVAIYTDYRDLLKHPDLDGIAMAIGPQAHQTITLEALKMGYPVFQEKPPAVDLAGAERVAEASEKFGKPVIVGFMKRYSTGNRIAKNITLNGDFGPILGICGSYMTAPTYFQDNRDYSGFYLHHCIHYMDLIPWFVNSEIKEMAIRKIEHQPGKLLFHLSLNFTSGAIGTIIMGTVQSRGTPMEMLQIMGDHRRLEIANIINVKYYRDPPFKDKDNLATLNDGQDTLCWSPNFTAAANEDHKGYHALLGDAIAAMKGEPSTAPTIKDGVKAMANLQAMIAALEQPTFPQ